MVPMVGGVREGRPQISSALAFPAGSTSMPCRVDIVFLTTEQSPKMCDVVSLSERQRGHVDVALSPLRPEVKSAL